MNVVNAGIFCPFRQNISAQQHVTEKSFEKKERWQALPISVISVTLHYKCRQIVVIVRCQNLPNRIHFVFFPLCFKITPTKICPTNELMNTLFYDYGERQTVNDKKHDIINNNKNLIQMLRFGALSICQGGNFWTHFRTNMIRSKSFYTFIRDGNFLAAFRPNMKTIGAEKHYSKVVEIKSRLLLVYRFILIVICEKTIICEKYCAS